MRVLDQRRGAVPAGAGRLALVVLTLVSVAGTPRTAGSTALAVAWSPDEVVIAADSRRTRGLEDPQVLSACKIRREGRTYWTAAGIHSDSREGHDVGRLVRQAVRREPTFERRVDAVESALVRPLQAALVRLRREAPVLFEADHDGSSALDVVFVAFEDGTARLAALLDEAVDEHGRR